MSLKAAIRSLERKAMKQGTCMRCGGRGTFDTVVECNGVLNRQPRPCKGCGKVACAVKIILED
jgi:hypothetical protein